MSSIPAVKLAIVNLLTTALPSAQIIYSGRNSVTITKNKIVTVGARVTGDSDFSAIDQTGGGTERYRIECQAQVTLPGTGLETADEAVVALWAATRDAVNAHSFDGGDGTLNVQIIGGFEFESAADKDGRYASVKFSADVFAILL